MLTQGRGNGRSCLIRTREKWRASGTMRSVVIRSIVYETDIAGAPSELRRVSNSE
jgi:hypothetical protein